MKRKHKEPDTPGWRIVRHTLAAIVVIGCIYLSVKWFAAGYVWGGAMPLAFALGWLGSSYPDDK